MIMPQVSKVTFSDGQTTISGRISRVTIRRDMQRLQVDLHGEAPLRIQGPGVEADIVLLKDVWEKEKLPFLIHEK
jgi:hypothetical protein